ncbi:Crp/Fnr family transcriptional regulator [Paludicola sp. MB14-C6]|uniref:Crp/Fnr family transcriptional regulator n=1 Tax=Paludihabitans sp. MB14-C6 TaxID=3070656 RepID=UPI0027DC5FB0|nr:Crp/Fnr family transcriptional regulator [Paludicola sp. MB14-C6]WMJ23736.1 Crp/Fnr family transcriptional regulator [Paludicola sp. MB14-C6]
MITSEQLDYVKTVLTFWNHLTPPERALLKQSMVSVNYKQGDVIHRGDSDCIGVLVVKSGGLRTYMLSEEGKEITLFRPRQGDVCVLSASCIMRNITFDVHIEADEDSEVIILNSSDFQQVCNENIYAENFSYKVTTDRFSDVMWAMEQILFMSFDKRLAIFLLDESAKNGSDFITLTHEQIAKYTGSAREVVSRMLKYFVNEGLVEVSRKGVKLLDKKKLRALL